MVGVLKLALLLVEDFEEPGSQPAVRAHKSSAKAWLCDGPVHFLDWQNARLGADSARKYTPNPALALQQLQPSVGCWCFLARCQVFVTVFVYGPFVAAFASGCPSYLQMAAPRC